MTNTRKIRSSSPTIDSSIRDSNHHEVPSKPDFPLLTSALNSTLFYFQRPKEKTNLNVFVFSLRTLFCLIILSLCEFINLDLRIIKFSRCLFLGISILSHSHRMGKRLIHSGYCYVLLASSIYNLDGLLYFKVYFDAFIPGVTSSLESDWIHRRYLLLDDDPCLFTVI